MLHVGDSSRAIRVRDDGEIVRVKVSTLVCAVLMAAASVAGSTSPFVAMRADLDSLAADGAMTAANLVIQIAPQDRKKVGERVWLRAELNRGSRIAAQLSEAAKFDEAGRTIVRVSWPPGRYELKVEIENAAGVGGFVVVPVEIPDFEDASGVEQESDRVDQPNRESPNPVDSAESTSENTEESPRLGAIEAESGTWENTPTEASAGSSIRKNVSSQNPAAGPEVDRSRWQGEMTVLLTSLNRPVSGVAVSDLQVRVNSAPAEVVGLYGDGESPLSLGIAVSGPALTNVPELRAHLGRAALFPSGPRDGVFLISGGKVPEIGLRWGQDIAGASEAFSKASRFGECNLASLVDESLMQFDTRLGRQVIVLATEGRDTASRDEWKACLSAAESSGIPILVVAYESAEMKSKTRQRLKDLARLSGGKSYVVRDPSMLKMVFDHFADLIDSASLLRFRSDARRGESALKVKIESDLPSLTVLHSNRVR